MGRFGHSRFDHRKYRAIEGVPLQDRQWPDRTLTRAPIWASVDLRDGNQALLDPMTVTQKRRMWDLLVGLGFKEIEIGFPAASQLDFDFTRMLVEQDLIPPDVQVQVLVQARKDLIERTFEALEGVPRAIVHVYNSTSPVQRERVFKMDRAGVLGVARQGAHWVREVAHRYPQTDWTFQYSPESFTNTEIDYAVEVCNAVIDVWQPTVERPCIINLPATVEVSSPNVFADQVEYFCRKVAHRDCILVSVHTHNDRGCAVAAGELAVLAGADRVEGTLLGNGERTGNMDILTMAMNLYSQGVDPQLDLSNPDEIIEVYTECTNLPVHPRHPWVGELVYTAFSGSHQDAIRKCLKAQQADEPWSVAYLPIDPEDIGRDYQAVIRVNSQSGKGGMAFVLERDYGLHLPRWMQVELSQVVQRLSEETGGELPSEVIHQQFLRHFVCEDGEFQLSGYSLNRNGRDRITARLHRRGTSVEVQGEGDGAISAFIDAWREYSGETLAVVDYQEHALSAGTDAMAIAYMQVSIAGHRVSGAAIDTDTVSASLKALLSVINRHLRNSQQAA
ncbi:MAG: 2-isopropylmalate synthase [Pseudomonadota bacterium]|nr:2-isopropylmalate synthase [Pseudomonadota bacterium]